MTAETEAPALLDELDKAGVRARFSRPEARARAGAGAAASSAAACCACAAEATCAAPAAVARRAVVRAPRRSILLMAWQRVTETLPTLGATRTAKGALRCRYRALKRRKTENARLERPASGATAAVVAAPELARGEVSNAAMCAAGGGGARASREPHSSSRCRGAAAAAPAEPSLSPPLPQGRCRRAGAGAAAVRRARNVAGTLRCDAYFVSSKRAPFRP